MLLKSMFIGKNIYLKTGIGIIILSALLFVLFILTQEDDYGVIWILLVELFLILIPVILIIVGWYKARKKTGNSLLVFYTAIFFILFSVNISSAAGSEPPMKVAWRTGVGMWFMEPRPTSIELIESDIVYVNYQNLQAIDANNGKLLWSKDWSAGVIYENGILYASKDLSSNLYALDARTGKEVWKKDYPELKRGIADRYNIALIDKTLFVTTDDGNTNILAVSTNGSPVDIEKFPAINSSRNYDRNQVVYKNKQYILKSGKLYAYEEGYDVPKYIYFGIFSIILTIAFLIIKTKIYSKKFKISFIFSAIFTVIVYSMILAFDNLNDYFIMITDLFSISSAYEDWFLYIIFPALTVISSTIAGMRIESKFLKGVIAGVLPFLIVFWASFFILPDSKYFFMTFNPVILSIYYFIYIVPISGITGIIIGFILKQIYGEAA